MSLSTLWNYINKYAKRMRHNKTLKAVTKAMTQISMSYSTTGWNI